MKTIICCFSVMGLLFINSATYAQNEDQDIKRPRHEINLGFSDLLQQRQDPPPIYYPPYYALADLAYYPPYYEETPLHERTKYGLGYKFHFGKNAARLSVAMRMDNSEQSDNNNGNGTYKITNDNFVLAYRIGYERTLIRNEKIDFYLAADFIALQAAYDYKYAYTGTPSNNDYSNKNETDHTETGGGLAVGIRYFVHKSISLGLETRTDYVTYTQKNKYHSESNGSPDSSYDSSEKEEGTKSVIKPLAFLSVNVHF